MDNNTLDAVPSRRAYIGGATQQPKGLPSRCARKKGHSTRLGTAAQQQQQKRLGGGQGVKLEQLPRDSGWIQAWATLDSQHAVRRLTLL